MESDKLFHYTTPAGLLGIANSKSLWATNIRYLNDSTEYLHSVEIARQLVQEKEGVTRQENLFLRSALMLESLAGRSEYFVTSLSEEPDRLSQWRAYSGRIGYCIGWSIEPLERMAAQNRFQLVKCIYDEDEQRRLIGEVLRDGLRSLRARQWRTNLDPLGIDLSLPDNDEEAALVLWRRVFRRQFDQVATVCKNKAFAEEREWRLVGRTSHAKHEESPIGFREGRTLIIPYIKFKVDVFESPNPNIIIGPHPEPDLARETTQSLFQNARWDVHQITNSSVPYREW